MAEPRIIRFGEIDCVVGLSWQFSQKRPKGLKRSHPHLILEDRATGTDLIEADGLPPFALLVAALCDEDKLCWVAAMASVTKPSRSFAVAAKASGRVTGWSCST